MNTLVTTYVQNTGLMPQKFITLAKTVGMKPSKAQRVYSAVSLEKLLTDGGPLWCAGYWFGFGHVIVLTGVDRGKVYFNDPDGGVMKEGRLDWLERRSRKSTANG